MDAGEAEGQIERTLFPSDSADDTQPADVEVPASPKQVSPKPSPSPPPREPTQVEEVEAEKEVVESRVATPEPPMPPEVEEPAETREPTPAPDGKYFFLKLDGNTFL